MDIASKDLALISPNLILFKEFVASVLSDFGRLDILVNSAALDPKFDPDAASKGIAPGNFEDYPLDQWNAALNGNRPACF